MRSFQVLSIFTSLAALPGCGDRGAHGNGETESAAPPVSAAANQRQVDDTAVEAVEEGTGEEPRAGTEQALAEEEDVPAPAPASPEVAARQFAAWLVDRTAPVPALLTSTARFEVAMHCDACDRAAPVKTVTVVGIDAMSALERQLRAGAVLDMWDFGDELDCKDGCCRFLIDPELGQSEHVIGLKRVCVATDEQGRPTGYTRVEGVGAWPRDANK
jgi:hypothetical protein